MERFLKLFILLTVFYFKYTNCENCDGFTMFYVPPLTCDQKSDILETHNEYRQQIALGKIPSQYSAQYMIELTWDDELATAAQNWANRCSIKHDPKRNVARFNVGQNIARTWTTEEPYDETDAEPDFDRAIDDWFSEVKKYKYNRVNNGTGHFTQIIWSDTWALGCGYSYYYDPSRGYTKNYVCNYGPSGNVKGQKPYIAGSPSCKSWGMEDSEYYSGLCLKGGVDYPLGKACAWSYS